MNDSAVITRDEVLSNHKLAVSPFKGSGFYIGLKILPKYFLRLLKADKEKERKNYNKNCRN